MTGPFLHPFAKPARPAFIRLVSGQGATVTTDSGQVLIDGMASLWYCAIGHGRREMAEAVATQITSLEAYSAFDPFTTEPADAVSARIAALSPIRDARVFLCGSGSESIDSAMKLARVAHVQGPREGRVQLHAMNERTVVKLYC